MGSQVKTIGRQEVEMIIVPCPRCGSWYTDPMDKKKQWWCCAHLDCRYIWSLEKHYCLVWLRGETSPRKAIWNDKLKRWGKEK